MGKGKDAPEQPKNGFAPVIEVARYLKVSKHTIYRAISAGLIRSTRIGGAIRVKWEDIHSLHS